MGVHVMNALVSEHVVSCMRNPVSSFMIKCTERETETDRERERVLLGTISLSTSEAEYVAASQCGQEVVYLREILRDFGFIPIGPTQVYEDNLACVAMSENPVRRKYSRHIDIRSYFVRDLVAQNVLKLIPLRTSLMVADGLTKSLPAPAHAKEFARSSTCETSQCYDWPRSIQRSHIAPIPLCLGWIILAGQGESSFFLSFFCVPYLHTFVILGQGGERF